MNPLVTAAIGSVLRWAFALAAGWLVQHGVWTQADATTYVTAAALGALSLGWSLWQKYAGRIKLLTALQAPAGTSEAEVTAKVSKGMGAKLTMLVLALVVYGATTASLCNPNLTPTANIENVAGQIEATGDQVLKTAVALNVSNPTVMTRARLDQVALFGDTLGRLGTELGNAIDAYNAAKTAGLSTATQAAAIQTIIANITQALADLGKQIPTGTVAAVDQAVTTILGLVAQVKAGAGL